MFEELKKFKNIIVTGPQRSGTHITARMIEHDAGNVYIDEREVAYTNIDCIKCVFRLSDPVVVQAPSYFWNVWKLPGDPMVVVCKRDVDDIKASRKRIHFDEDVSHYYISPKAHGYDADGRYLPVIQYEYWDRVVKPMIKNWIEVEYESLSAHPLWIDKELRKDFRPNQTKVEE